MPVLYYKLAELASASGYYASTEAAGCIDGRANPLQMNA